MLTFCRAEHIHGRQTQRFNLTVQRLLKPCPGFARARISIFDLSSI
jgi:hypothetical protein